MLTAAIKGVKPIHLDLFEKYALCIIFSVFSYRMILGYWDSGATINLLYIFDQMLVLGFILMRRSTNEISTKASDWLVGFAGTFLALLYGPTGDNPLVPIQIAFLLMLSGLLVHLSAKIILRRSFGVVAADRGVKSTGPYRLVRHPMYLGYMLTHLGLVLAGPTLLNVVLTLVIWALFISRISAEERILNANPSYATLPRYRLVPGVF